MNLARISLLVVSVCIFACCSTHCFQYDIWFKYPHPYTQTVPITYCSPEAAAASQQTGASQQQQQQQQCTSQVPVFVNTLDSPKTLIPYALTQLVDFCKLKDAKEFEQSSHTEWDDSIKLAPFDIKFLRNEECKILCKKSYKLNAHADLYRLEELKLGLTRDYYHHWFADTLPFSWCYRTLSPKASQQQQVRQPIGGLSSQLTALNSNTAGKECFIGFPIGYSTDERGLPEDERVPIANFTKPNALFLFNHFDFTIFYESGDGKPWAGRAGSQAGRITALRISPRSIDHAAQVAGIQSQQQPQSAGGSCEPSQLPMEIPASFQYGLNVSISLSYSYSVRFVEDDASASWTQRWQRLEATLPGTWRGKWVLAIIITTLLLTGSCAAYAIARTLFADRKLVFINTDLLESPSDAPWRQLSGDIFREPPFVGLFCVFVGAGCQFLALVVLSELFAVFIALFSTSILFAIIVLFVVLYGFIGGYFGTKLYRTFGGDDWKLLCCFITALNPLVIFCMFVASRNLLLLYNGSLMAMSIDLFASLFVVLICFAVSLPTTLVGGSVAFRSSSFEFPARPTANKRQLPDGLAWKRSPLHTTLVLGLIPLMCIWCVELYPFYDSGGYIISLLTITIVACLSVAHCYLHLSQFDYRWWWRSYMVCGSAAIYFFLHSVYYIFNNLFVDTLTNAILYVSFSFFMALAIFLFTGTISFLVTFAFLWQIYARANASPDMNYAMFQKAPLE